MANISHNAVKHSLLSCQAIIRGESRRADRLFMQNKANLQKAYMSVKSCCAWDYDDLSALGPGKNKAKQTQSAGYQGKQLACERRIIGEGQKDRLFGIDY